MEVSSVEGVVEKVLADSDCPWKKYQDLRRVSSVSSVSSVILLFMKTLFNSLTCFVCVCVCRAL